RLYRSDPPQEQTQRKRRSNFTGQKRKIPVRPFPDMVPFKRREVNEISVDRRNVLDRKGVKFVQTVALRVDPDEKIVYT
ncbi:hypothetical protein OFN50_40280, partial [Escherichia coli]|nr:hypothetical protein [Escherichia coli]